MFCGAQISLYPMCDRFVEVILKGLEKVREIKQVRFETDDLSTCVIGPPYWVFQVAKNLFQGAAQTGVHVVMHALFSRGCPGEPDDPICTPCTPESPLATPELLDLRSLPLSNIPVAAQFSLYPLGSGTYMETIYRQIQEAKQEGTYSKGKHFVSRLDGDLERVFGTVYNAFQRASSEVGHVVVHLTVSANSPTAKKST